MSFTLPPGFPLGSLSTIQLLWIAGGIAVVVVVLGLYLTSQTHDGQEVRKERSRTSGLLRPTTSHPDLYRVGRSRQWVRSKAAADPDFRREDDVDQAPRREVSTVTPLSDGAPDGATRAERVEERSPAPEVIAAAPQAAQPGDEGIICPFLSIVEQGDGSTGTEDEYRCLASRNDPITLTTRYLEVYCLTTRHRTCSLYLHFDKAEEDQVPALESSAPLGLPGMEPAGALDDGNVPAPGAGQPAPAGLPMWQPIPPQGDTATARAEPSRPVIPGRAPLSAPQTDLTILQPESAPDEARDRDAPRATSSAPESPRPARPDIRPIVPGSVARRRSVETDVIPAENQRASAGDPNRDPSQVTIVDAEPVAESAVEGTEVKAIPIDAVPRSQRGV